MSLSVSFFFFFLRDKAADTGVDSPGLLAVSFAVGQTYMKSDEILQLACPIS